MLSPQGHSQRVWAALASAPSRRTLATYESPHFVEASGREAEGHAQDPGAAYARPREGDRQVSRQARLGIAEDQGVAAEDSQGDAQSLRR
jgi:hypothetical protein